MIRTYFMKDNIKCLNFTCLRTPDFDPGGASGVGGIHYLHHPIIHLFYPPKLLHNHCLQVLLGHEDVLREIRNNACANFWGVKEVYYGICASSE